MKDYFSRLIQQTGISIASARGQSLARQNAEVIPIHVEEEKITGRSRELTEGKNFEDSVEKNEILSQIGESKETQQLERYDQSFFQNYSSPRDTLESSYIHSERESFHRPIEQRLEMKFSQELKNQEFAEQKALTFNHNRGMVKNGIDRDNSKNYVSTSKNRDAQQVIEENIINEFPEGLEKHQPEEKKGEAYFRNTQSSAKGGRYQLEANDLSDNEVEIDFGNQIQESEETVTKEFRESTTSESAMDSTDQIIRDRPIYLKEVREWVAENLPFGGEEIKSGTEIDKSESENKGHIKGGLFTLSYPELHQKPEFNDLRLSIGTISLIIEEPHKKESPQQIIKVDNRPMQETKTSRLSRYYIRTR